MEQILHKGSILRSKVYSCRYIVTAKSLLVLLDCFKHKQL